MSLMVGQFQNTMLFAVGQRLNILTIPLGAAVSIANGKVLDLLAFDHLSVNKKTTALQFDFISRKTDNPFDEVRLVVLRIFKHHNIAALRLVFPNSAFKQRQAPRQRMFGIAVGIFGNKQIISHIQRQIH